MTPYTIVLGFDFSPPAEIALEQAIALAGNRPEVRLHALAVLDDHHGLALGRKKPDIELADHVQQELRAALDARLAESELSEALVFAHVRIGDAAAELLRLSVEAAADVIVVGTHGRRGVRRLVLGSVAGEVSRKATVPVLVARPAVHEAANIGDEPEAPCPDCAATRAATGGASWWCAVHDKPYAPPHRYHYQPAISARAHQSDDPR